MKTLGLKKLKVLLSDSVTNKNFKTIKNKLYKKRCKT